MLSATSGTLRIGAGRIVPRAAPRVAAVASSARRDFLSRHRNFHNVNNARSLSTTQRPGYVATTNPNPPFGKRNTSNDTPSRVALIGGRGYTGQALVELFDKHPYMDLRHVLSRELVGQELKGYNKRKIIYENLSAEECAQLDVDAYVLALPNGVSQPYVDAIDQAEKGKDKKSLIVDLSADYRFDDSWTYSLPELTGRSKIAQSTRISNPVTSWFRGIHLTINIPLNKSMNSRDIRNIYQDRYAGEKLIKVLGEAPYVKSIQGKHFVETGGFTVDQTGKRVVVCATIDNLNKGASTQCLQNMNLALGYAEYEGIPVM
ncbi:hypothetical protein DL764_003534 [Monosporascus ibericus]|uniref:Semialdehyde dehydrogenase NAD-binding domain-containing protein n=1 Tax=Monosporascus ibericus TaxID=155417 RepID=A0A4Q4TKN7_9PEZI|nr:hypothetical protein DL764_003534 [Monosporascus ibericus]